MTDELTREYEAVRSSVGAMWIDRDVLAVSGPDAESFLQGQVTQDVVALNVGASAWSFVLQPHGKVDALVRISRTADGYVIDTDSGFGALVRDRLERFKLRTKVEVEPLDWKVLALRGPQSQSIDAGDATIAANAGWPGVIGVDLLGAKPDVPNGVKVCSQDVYEVLRIESGVPQMGREMDEKTIPAEVGMNARTISFTKGCYTGQELVARIDSRGNNVPRHLRCLILEGSEDDAPARGSHIVPSQRNARSQKPMGVLSSVAYSPRLQAPVGLALIRRDVIVPAEGTIEGDSRAILCKIEAAPLL